MQSVHTAGATLDWNKSRSSEFNTATRCHGRQKTRGRGAVWWRAETLLREGVKWEPTSIIDGPMHRLMRTGDQQTRSPPLPLDGGSLNARAGKFTSHENFIGRDAAEHIITEWESEREMKAGGETQQ